jgi:hypothetical protein
MSDSIDNGTTSQFLSLNMFNNNVYMMQNKDIIVLMNTETITMVHVYKFKNDTWDTLDFSTRVKEGTTDIKLDTSYFNNTYIYGTYTDSNNQTKIFVDKITSYYAISYSATNKITFSPDTTALSILVTN